MSAKRFTHSRPLSNRQIDKIPDDKPAVYEIKNRAGDNIYTGVAKRGRVQDRLREHLPGAKDAIPGAADFSIKQKRSIESAKNEEKIIIKAEEPKHND